MRLGLILGLGVSVGSMMRLLLRTSAALLAACTLHGAALASQPVATYRVEVSQDALDSWMEFRGDAPFLRGEHAIDGLVLVETAAAEALKNGIDQRPAVRLELNRMAGSAALLRIKQELSSEVVVKPEEIDAHLASGAYPGAPQRIRLRNLFRRLPEDPEKGQEAQKVREAMEGYRLAVLAGADFAALAAEHSESETRWRQGLVGNVPPGTFREDVDRIVQAMSPGDVSEVLETGGGLSLFYCESILPPRVPSEADRRKASQNFLWRRQFEPRWQELLDTLEASAEVRIVRRNDTFVGLRWTGTFLNAEESEIVLGQEALQRWLAATPGSNTASLPPNLKTFVRGQMARLYKAEQGWRDDAKTRAHQRWRRLQALANHQIAAWVEKRFEEPSGDAVRKRFEAQRTSYEVPEIFHISLIQLPLNEGDPRQDYAQAAAILEAVREGRKTFEEAAKEHSKHASAANGGHLGSLTRDRLSSRLGLDLSRALQTLDVGEISEIVTTEDGLFVLRLDRKEEKRLANFDEARDAVFQELAQERLDELQVDVVEAWLTRLEIVPTNNNNQ